MILQKKYRYLYKITNLINSKIYVGIHSTDNLDDGYMGSGKALHFAKLKHGIENFKKEIISFHDSFESLVEAEATVVNREFVNRGDTYNLCLGGAYTPITQDSILANSLGQKRYWNKQSPEFIATRMSIMGRKAHWPKARFDNWRSNLSKANKGNPNVSRANKQIWQDMSDETIEARNAKLSATKKKVYSTYTVEERQALTSAATEAAKRRIVCKHCGKDANIGNHNRWHGNKCKLNPENMK